MKYYIYILLFLIISSCRVIDGFKIYGDDKSCFSKQEIKKIIKSNSENYFKSINLNAIIINKNDCIGLFQNNSNSIKSISKIQKILKIENETYIFNYKDTILNKKKMIEFKMKYKNKFSSSKLDSISIIFLKGDELRGSIY